MEGSLLEVSRFEILGEMTPAECWILGRHVCVFVVMCNHSDVGEGTKLVHPKDALPPKLVSTRTKGRQTHSVET